jgi:NAD(P) transhydrogenase subunit alpha
VNQTYIDGLYVFVLAAFLGFVVISRVSVLLHTPLMSLTNAIAAISLVGSLLLAGSDRSTLATVLGTIAVTASTANVVGGFLITDRMLKMFKTGRGDPPRARQQADTPGNPPPS